MVRRTRIHAWFIFIALSSCAYETSLENMKDDDDDDDDDHPVASGDDIVCHPLSLDTCCLPMPSDTYTSDTVDECLPGDLLRILPDSMQPSKLLAERDGWSPSMPVLFEAPYEVDAQSIPLDGGDVLRVYDLSDPDLASIPVRVRLSRVAEIQNRRIHGDDPSAETTQVIEAHPRSRFPYGHQLVALLTTALPSLDGSTAETVELPPIYDDVMARLELRGVRRDEILSLTEFTIATEENTTGKLFEMIDVVESQPHPIRNISYEYNLFETPEMGAVFRGEVLLTSFREADGSVQFEAGDEGEPDWTEFDLYIPHQARIGPVPVVIYGHGIGMDKSSARWIALINSINGIATIAIDWPNHGSRRTAEEGGDVFENAETERLGYLFGMTTQGVVDFHSLLAAVQTTIAENSDVLPWNRNIATQLLFPNGYGYPDIDVSRVHYMGTSLGGVLGSGFVGSTQAINSAFFQVGGTGIIRTLALSDLFESKFIGVLPTELGGAESAIVFYMAQHVLDLSDGNNLIHNIRSPQGDGHNIPLFLQYGLGDSIVHNDSSLALAELASLPNILPVFQPVDYLETSLFPVDGFALFQADPTLGSDFLGSLIEPFVEDLLWPLISGDSGRSYESLMHASFAFPRSLMVWETWLLSMH